MISANRTSTASTDKNNDTSGSTFQLLNVPTKLNNVNSLIRGVSHQKPTTMPDGYIPSDSDVCCGRGKKNWNMTGNVSFRKLIRASVARYMAASLKNEKTAVVISVFDEIRRQGGHFLKQQRHGSSSRWYDIGDAAAREKVGHSLRDQVGRGASAAKSPLQLAKEHTRRAATATSDCDSEDSTDTTEAGDSVDSADSVAARLTETSSLPSLSSSSSLSCTEENIVDFVPVTALSRGISYSSAPIDISSAMGGIDLLPTNSSQLLLSDFLVGCYDL
jgi:hypothetical protein